MKINEDPKKFQKLNVGEIIELSGHKYLITNVRSKMPKVELKRKSTSKGRPLSRSNPDIEIHFDPENSLGDRSKNSWKNYGKYSFPSDITCLDEKGVEYVFIFTYKLKTSGNDDPWAEYITAFREIVKNDPKMSRYQVGKLAAHQVLKKFNILEFDEITVRKGSASDAYANIYNYLHFYGNMSSHNIKAQKSLEKSLAFLKHDKLSEIIDLVNDHLHSDSLIADYASKHPEEFAD